MTHVFKIALVLATCLTAGAACAQEPAPEPGGDQVRVMTVLTDPDPQTQLMGLILTRASLEAGAQAQLLLCGPAGDLALAEPTQAGATALAPRGMSPHGLLGVLIEAGVTVQVCAIYLPNSEHAADALRAGVGQARPAEIAAVMTAPQTRLFTF